MIVGIDEVGRGCWAGPLVAAAVVYSEPLIGLKDSKKLSAVQRKNLAKMIRRHAESIGIGWVDASEVDRIGISAAVTIAMSDALGQINVPYERIIIDGNRIYLNDGRAEAVVKADDHIPSVSAASIIAKVARDDYMAKIAALFPQYEFERHVGYGTEIHRDALRQYGACQLHRMSFRPVKLLSKMS